VIALAAAFARILLLAFTLFSGSGSGFFTATATSTSYSTAASFVIPINPFKFLNTLTSYLPILLV
jgi:hypothetical protein